MLHRFRALIETYPGTALLGEVSSQEGAFARIARYTEAGEGLHMAYTLRPLRKDTLEHALGEALGEIAAAAGSGWLCWAFSNHDVERVASRWNPLKERGLPPPKGFVEMLMALLLTLRGSVSIYQGEELGLEEAELALGELRDPFGIAYFPEFAGRDGSRTPMPWRADAPHAGFSVSKPWLPVPRAHFAASVAEAEADPSAPLHAWRRMMEWRKAHRALVAGSFERLDAPHPLLMFERRLGADRVVAVFNPSAQPQTAALGPGVAAVLASTGARVAEGAGTLPPWGYCFAAMPAHETAPASLG